jgi:hypothetical protein
MSHSHPTKSAFGKMWKMESSCISCGFAVQWNGKKCYVCLSRSAHCPACFSWKDKEARYCSSCLHSHSFDCSRCGGEKFFPFCRPTKCIRCWYGDLQTIASRCIECGRSFWATSDLEVCNACCISEYKIALPTFLQVDVIVQIVILYLQANLLSE